MRRMAGSVGSHFVCVVLMASVSLALGHGSRASVVGDSRPGQTALSGRYGPFCTIRDGRAAASDRPARAYEPFERLEREKTQARRSAQVRYCPDRVLLKLAPVGKGGLRVMSSGAEADVSTIAGVESVERLFPVRSRSSSKLRLAGADPDEATEDGPDLTRWYRAQVKAGHDVQEVLAEAANHPAVELAEPDYVFHLVGRMPDGTTDPDMARQWHLDKIRASEAWQHLESLGLSPGGSRDVVVAVIDSGVDYTHPDLAANMWVNRQEIADNGQDDDWNGFIDDVHGVSVLGDERDHSGDPMDLNGHGTHVAGIIAAVADNGVGGVGVAYNTRIMAIKAAQYNGEFYASDIAEAVYYAIENGADVINMSLSSGAHSKVMDDALSVAFGQAVLVAAAGNDGAHNEEPPKKPAAKPGFPASYVYVLGVMAQREQADSKGQNLAGFSNWDNHPDSRIEYEVMAPGADIFSTLPGEGYAAWDGTSMAAPVVSGIAALVRTKFPNKATHSSRFIMGQIASTGPILIGKQFDENDYMAIATFGFQKIEYPSVDAYAALTNVPQPDLGYFEHWLFDTPDQGPDNDDDGILDAGETVDLAIVIRNRWGKADNVVVTLAPVARQGALPDPYVTMLTDTVDYGAVGSFNQDDNGLIYEDDVIVSVEFPFTFALDPGTPNDHVVPFLLTMTCRNGLDPSDSRLYTFTSEFEMVVQRGRELPKIIDADMTLTKQHYWIIDQPTFIPEGVTVTVTEGTQIQFWSPVPRSPYSYGNEPSLLVEGRLDVKGTASEPVDVFPSERYHDRIISIQEGKNGRATFDYVRLMNPVLGSYYFPADDRRITAIDHAYFTQWGGIISGFGSGDDRPPVDPYIWASHVSHSIFDELGAWPNYWPDPLRPWEHWSLRVRTAATCLFDSCHLGGEADNHMDHSVFLGNYLRFYSAGGESIQASKALDWGSKIDAASNQFVNNAFLNEWWNPDINYWMLFHGSEHSSHPSYLTGNYWGTTSRTLIEAAVHDRWDQFNLSEVVYEPILEGPPESAYPFVVDVQVSTDTEDDAQQVGAEEIFFTVTFNRDMDTTVQPDMSFGPDVPFTDYLVNPVGGNGWIDARTWIGRFEVTPITGDGWQYIRVADAVAADDPWLKTGNDERRFRFEIITGGLASIDLQAESGPGYVDLTWHQDDFELFAGFNLYRATEPEPNGVFARLNTTILSVEQGSYRDADVQPNTTYYYKYAVVTTDMSESDYSNTVSAMPLEVNPPQIQHQPITSAEPGLSVTFRAIVTDETAVESVSLYYRQVGQAEYQSRPMMLTYNSRYSVTLEGALIEAPGLEYYIEASDGLSVANDGSAASPHRISVQGPAAPEIVHELVTEIGPGEPLTVCAQVTDDKAVVSVYVYYRPRGQVEYESQRMTLAFGTLYCGALPASATEGSGLEYYLEADNGSATATHGSPEDPHVVYAGVVGAPEIAHEPLTDATPGEPLSICAQITDDEGIVSATVHYRTVGETTYQSLAMNRLLADFYCATLAAAAVEAPGLEYYIAAGDGTNTSYCGRSEQPIWLPLVQANGKTGVKLDNTAEETQGYDQVKEECLSLCQDFLAIFDAGSGSTIEVTFLADVTTSAHRVFLASYDSVDDWVDYEHAISTTVFSNAGTGGSDMPLTATVTLTSPIFSGTRYAACLIPSEYVRVKLTRSTSSIDGRSSKFVPWTLPGPEVVRETDFRLRIDVKTYVEPERVMPPGR